MTEPLFTAAEVADRLGASAWWVREQCRLAKMPHRWIARKYMFTAADLEQIVAAAAVPVLENSPPKASRRRQYPVYNRRQA